MYEFWVSAKFFSEFIECSAGFFRLVDKLVICFVIIQKYRIIYVDNVVTFIGNAFSK